MAALVKSWSRPLAKRWAKTSAVRPMSNGHSEDGYKVWKKAFFFGAIPVITLGHINAFILVEEAKRPEFVPYEHLRSLID